MNTGYISFIVTILIASQALSQTPDYCSIAITERAFDRVNSVSQSRVAFAARDDLCSQEYESIGEAERAARNRGFNLGFKGFSLVGSDARQSSTGRWEISETSFCTASATDLEEIFETSYTAEIASVALSAWSQCVSSSTKNLLFLDYEVSQDGTLFTGTFHTTANNGTLYREIRGIAAVGDAKESVVCNIGGSRYSVKDSFDEPIVISETGTAIACERTEDGLAQVAFQTSAGATPFIELPSTEMLEAREWDQLRDEMNAELSKLSQSDGEIRSTIASSGWISGLRYVRGPGSPWLYGGNSERVHTLGIRADAGFCFMTGLSGQMDGGGERAYLEVRNGIWHAILRSHENGKNKVRASFDCVALR